MSTLPPSALGGSGGSPWPRGCGLRIIRFVDNIADDKRLEHDSSGAEHQFL
jgi:hypothetical protein